MAFSGLLALLDDVSAIADDVATMTLAAGKKTTGIVTDDMAVTAEQALGIERERELPVVWKVALGSLFNKGVILVPAALLIAALVPWALTPLLMLGGAYLCFEGVEKVLHKVTHPTDHEKTHGAPEEPVDPAEFERERVWGAIRTDFILSAEIIAISLGEVADETLAMQIAVLYLISVIMTIGVYGVVAVLVKLDDMGEALVRAGGGAAGLGRAILVGTPWLLKAISWIGAVAMLLVGGGILMHGIKPLEHWLDDTVHALHLHWLLEEAVTTGAGLLLGVIIGGILVGIVATGIPGRIWSLMPWVESKEQGDGAH